MSGKIHALATLSYVKELPFRSPWIQDGGLARTEYFENKVLYPYR